MILSEERICMGKSNRSFMKYKTLILLPLLGLAFTSCHRSHREVWEDTKTAKRYVNKGIQSLFGKHADNHQIAKGPKWKAEPEFMPLSDDARYSGPGSSESDFASSSLSSGMKDYPISRESPGDPGSSIPGIDGFSEPSGKLAQIFNTIHFETDGYTVKGSENLDTLHAIAEYLKSNPSTYVFVEGHADERGAASYNLSLGSRRSNGVRGYLIDQGVHPDQLFTISYGKERPLALGHDDAAWQENRRAQFKVYER
jgi:peptidoglycan-associated lipoprotein